MEFFLYVKDDDYYYDNEKKLFCFFKIVNLFEIFINIMDFLIVVKFIVIVYIVDKNNEIYKSEKFMILMEEGGKLF